MSGGFSFPPPPPPPKPATSLSDQHGQARQSNPGAQNNRGRGSYGRGPRGRGESSARGKSFPQSSHSSGGFAPGWQNGESHLNDSRPTPNHDRSGAPPNQSQSSYNNTIAPPIGSHAISSHPRTLAGHKRKLDALKPPNEQPKKHGPPTAPSVPSFGTSFVSTKPSIPVNKPAIIENGAGTMSGRRSIGLTPSTHESATIKSENEPDDLDEESMYAELGSKLTFEHNGVVMSLKSQADLTAWKKERQKNWPTKARMIERDDQRRQIGEDRRRLLRISTPLPRSEDSRRLKAKHSAGSGISGSVAQNSDERVKRLSELRKKVLDSEAKNREAKTQARQTEVDAAVIGAPPDSPNELPERMRIDLPVNLVTEYDSASEDEAAGDNLEESSSETSSDSSSEWSSDAASDEDAPEVMTSKPSQAQVEVDARPVCRFYAKSGHCRYGDACNFRHERSATTDPATGVPQREQRTAKKGARSDDQSVTAKKGIFQRLKEQEQKEEDRMALQVIKHLGKAGFFSDKSPTEINGRASIHRLNT